MNPLVGEEVLNLGENKNAEPSFVSRATDPLISPNYTQPGDFSAQYPTPLDPTEVITMCEEITLYRRIPVENTSLSSETWRELDTLAFTGSATYLAFADGACPEEYYHSGDNQTVTLKNLGAKKNLSVRDIMHSAAVASQKWGAINTLVAGAPAGEGLPGGLDYGTFQRNHVRDVKVKEVSLAMTLVMNGIDDTLVNGDTNSNALEFDGIENWATNMSCTFHTNDNSSSGTFSAISFDRFLSEGCAKPTALLAHPQPMQELMSAYFQLGYQGSQVVNFTDGNRITPGYNFGGFVNTGVGTLEVIADNNFRKTAAGTTTFQADIWAMRMTHNGEPMVYQIVQIPLSLNDLAPGCTAISFEVWTAMALIIKGCCMHGKYTSQFTGRVATTCTVIA
jgi:hypothetical protein